VAALEHATSRKALVLGKPAAEFFQAVGLPIYEGYGLSETSPVITLNGPGASCIGSVGRVVGDQELRIAEDGEILVRGSNVMKGYYNNPEATANVLSPDGWLRTGDLGLLDAEGYLFITGRLKDVIILGGANVAPADIEEVVDGVPGVRYSAAVGLDNERSGTQRLHVVAEVRGESIDDAAGLRLVREIVNSVHRASGHRPARVLLVKSGTIPKTSSGKIQRSRLVQMIQGGELAERVVHS